MGSTPKAPKQTAAQKAFDIEQRKALNEETIEVNRKKKALIRGTLGSASLLSGIEEQVTAGGGAPLDGGTSRSGVASGSNARVKSGKKTGTSATGKGASR